MTYAIAAAMALIGMGLMAMSDTKPVSRMGPIFAVGGAIVLVLRFTGAIA